MKNSDREYCEPRREQSCNFEGSDWSESLMGRRSNIRDRHLECHRRHVDRSRKLRLRTRAGSCLVNDFGVNTLQRHRKTKIRLHMFDEVLKVRPRPNNFNFLRLRSTSLAAKLSRRSRMPSLPLLPMRVLTETTFWYLLLKPFNDHQR